jgi:hypothetical protein
MQAWIFPNLTNACAYGDIVDAALGYPNAQTHTDTWAGSTDFPEPIVVHHIDGRAAYQAGAPAPAPDPEPGTFLGEGPESISELEWKGGPPLPGLP